MINWRELTCTTQSTNTIKKHSFAILLNLLFKWLELSDNCDFISSLLNNQRTTEFYKLQKSVLYRLYYAIQQSKTTIYIWAINEKSKVRI